MNQELTPKQRARVFAQYWDCRVSEWHEGKEYPFCNPFVDADVMDRVDSTHANVKLELRPLSAITDEDATELCSVCVRGCIPSVAKGKRFAGNVSRGNNSRFDPEANFGAGSQFLIQRGYAVPLFIAPGHPCNGKDAIQLRLAIDITKS